MNVSEVPNVTEILMTTVANQVQTAKSIQAATLKAIAESQQEWAQILQAAGTGQNIDTQA